MTTTTKVTDRLPFRGAIYTAAARGETTALPSVTLEELVGEKTTEGLTFKGVLPEHVQVHLPSGGVVLAIVSNAEKKPPRAPRAPRSRPVAVSRAAAAWFSGLSLHGGNRR